MRIAFLTRDFPPIICGVGDYTEQLARAAVAAGHEVVVLTGEPNGKVSIDGEEPDLRVLPVLAPVRLGLSRVFNEIRALRPDLVSLQYTPVSFGRFGLAPEAALLPLLLRGRKIPLATTLHETYLPNPTSVGLRAISAAQAAQLVPILAGSTRVVVNSQAALHRMQTLFPWSAGKLAFAPNGSSIPRVALGPGEAAEVRRRWGLGEDIVLATFGTMRPDKDMITVVRALARLAARWPVKLLCAGYAGDRGGAAVQAAVQREADALGVGDRVVWTGSLPRSEVSRCLGVADVFILPFLGGPGGNRSSLVPALEHGLPVVAFAGPASSSLADQGSVLLVAPQDPPRLADAIHELIEEPLRRQALGRSAREAFEKMWTWQHVLAATLGEP